MIPHLSERGLILTPHGRDAEIATQMLTEARIRSVVCRTLAELLANLKHGAGFAVVTEEALLRADLHPLADWIGAQPEWSDFPFILLTIRGGIERNPAAMRLLRTLGNVTFLERPFHPTTLVSLAQSAIRGRRRQYEARGRLKALAELNETLEARVDAAITEHKVLADVVESTDALVQVVDLERRILAVNLASAGEFERLLGVRPKVGDFLPELLAGAPELEAALGSRWARALEGEEFTDVLQIAETDGSRRYYEMKFNTLYDRKGNRIGAYQFVYDVTKRLEDQERLATTESALRQAQKMEAVGQLTGGVAHDFNNLLMAFSSGMYLLDQPMDAVRRRRVADGMRQAIDRGTALTRQLLAFSRRRPLSAKTVDLRERLLGMQEILQRSLRGDVVVEMSFDDDLWLVDLDPGELELAIINICVNSRDAMPDGGTIHISAQNARNQLAPAAGDAVTLVIADSGVGMSSAVLPRVFEPFFTTKEVGRGSGLGLAQVYGFVAQSKGQVTIDSAPEKGTTVTLTFPRSNAEFAETAEKPRRSVKAIRKGGRNAGARGNILLVEDDLTVAALTNEMLVSAGYSVQHVKSASEALSALATGTWVDVVFSDVMMPGGMSGVDLANEVRKRSVSLPIVLTTGYVEVARTAMADGLEVLVKPYSLDVLMRIFDAHIAARQADLQASPA